MTKYAIVFNIETNTNPTATIGFVPGGYKKSGYFMIILTNDVNVKTTNVKTNDSSELNNICRRWEC